MCFKRSQKVYLPVAPIGYDGYYGGYGLGGYGGYTWSRGRTFFAPNLLLKKSKFSMTKYYFMHINIDNTKGIVKLCRESR